MADEARPAVTAPSLLGCAGGRAWGGGVGDLPYAVFCCASPALNVLYGFTGFEVERIAPELTTSTEEPS